MRFNHPFLTICALMALVTGPSYAQAPNVTLEIRNHAFSQDTLVLPANLPVTIILKNNDDTPEEFESSDMKVEKIIGGNRVVSVHIPALPPGVYGFIGEYHRETAHGVVQVR